MNRSSKLTLGSSLPTVVREVHPRQIRLYSEVSGDYNPLHLDENFAQTTAFGGTVAHGMLILAFLSNVMDNAFPSSWPVNGHLKVRFREAARPGDTITVTGTVIQITEEDSELHFSCLLEAVNHNGRKVATAEARVNVSDSPV